MDELMMEQRRREEMEQQRLDAETEYTRREALAHELMHLLRGGLTAEQKSVAARVAALTRASQGSGWRPHADIALSSDEALAVRTAAEVAGAAVAEWAMGRRAELEAASEAAAMRREQRIGALRKLVPRGRVP